MLKRGLVKVLPTHVGMSRTFTSTATPPFSAPHTRGDEPQTKERQAQGEECSPHTWG